MPLANLSCRCCPGLWVPYTIISNAGTKLNVITGRAGTGKTIHLLQVAFKLASRDNHKRCLLLTYNRALVNDIRRLIDFTDMPAKMDGRTVSINTSDSFFINLLKEWGVDGANDLNPAASNYKEKFRSCLQKFLESLANETTEEIAAYRELAGRESSWDYILIDEAQDWDDLRKQVLFKVFGANHIIVADGVDQFMENNKKQDWTYNVQSVNKPAAMTKERRQKTALVDFANAFSKIEKLGWEVKRNNDLPGGDIYIYNSFRIKDYNDIIKNINDNNCELYDTLILVPPTMVEQDEKGNKYFVHAEAYSTNNLQIYDGTNDNNRSSYPTKDLMRVYQYDSCRGLEGWVTVCMRLDELVEYKIQSLRNSNVLDDYLGLDSEVGLRKFVYTWLLIPFTRPIDRLIITLKDKDSEIGKILKKLADANHGAIHWECE